MVVIIVTNFKYSICKRKDGSRYIKLTELDFRDDNISLQSPWYNEFLIGDY